MPKFCAVFNCSYRADRENEKSNYRFPSIVKNNGKESLKLSKVRRVQIFRKNLTERKPERTRAKIKIILSASLSSFFSHKVYNTRFEKQILILF